VFFFGRKRSKKTFINWRRAKCSTLGPGAHEQEAFASFLQKRRPFFVFVAEASLAREDTACSGAAARSKRAVGGRQGKFWDKH
jgi:hypothetical protein